MPDVAYAAFWHIFGASLGIASGVMVVGAAVTLLALLWLAILGSARRRNTPPSTKP